MHVEELEDRLVPPSRLGRAQDRARRRSLRGRATARRGRRPHRRCLARSISGPRSRRRAQRVLRAGRRDPGRRVTLASSVLVAQRPVRTGPQSALRFSSLPRLGPGRVCLRQRPTDRAHRLDLKRPPRSSAVPPRGGGTIGRASPPYSPTTSSLELPGATEQPR